MKTVKGLTKNQIEIIIQSLDLASKIYRHEANKEKEEFTRRFLIHEAIEAEELSEKLCEVLKEDKCSAEEVMAEEVASVSKGRR